MHAKFLFFASMTAAVVSGTTSTVTKFTFATTMYLHEQRPQDVPVQAVTEGPFQPAHSIDAHTGLLASNNNSRQASKAIPREAVVPLPSITAVARYLVEGDESKYLPQPTSLPSTTPHYPKDMVSYREAIIASNKAHLAGSAAESSYLRSQSIASLKSGEDADGQLMTSAAASQSLASQISATEAANFASASKHQDTLKSQRKKLEKNGAVNRRIPSTLQAFVSASVVALYVMSVLV